MNTKTAGPIQPSFNPGDIDQKACAGTLKLLLIDQIVRTKNRTANDASIGWWNRWGIRAQLQGSYKISNFKSFADIAPWRRKKDSIGNFLEIGLVTQKVANGCIVARFNFSLEDQAPSENSQVVEGDRARRTTHACDQTNNEKNYAASETHGLLADFVKE